MKTFRRSFWQATTSKWYITFTVIVAILITPFVYFATHSLGACLLLLLIWSLMCFPIYFTQYFYVILTDDQLILKNSIYTFWYKEYFYKDITKVEIKPSTNIFMKVHLEKPRTFSGTYVIDLVAPVDYDELIDCLRAKGVVVETAGLDIRFSDRNKRKISVISRKNDTNKVFRRSFWAACNVNSMIIPWVVGSIFCYFLMIEDGIDPSRLLSFYGFLFLGTPTLGVLTYFFVSEFYVILSDDALILKNAICPFWTKKVFYGDPVKLKIIYLSGYTIPYIQIIRGARKFAWRYYLDRVRLKDFPAIIDYLREKGIEVHVNGMEYFK